MNKIPLLSRLFQGGVDLEERDAYRTAIPVSVNVSIVEDGDRLIARVNRLDDDEVKGLLITEAPNHDQLVTMINDVILTYKNVPEQYRDEFSRLLLPEDPAVFTQVRESKSLNLVKN